MSVTERKAKAVISETDCFGGAMPDGRLTAPSDKRHIVYGKQFCNQRN